MIFGKMYFILESMPKIKLSRLSLALIIFVVIFSFTSKTFAAVSSSDLNQNGINDADESEVVLSSDAVLPAGEYFFNNLIITNNATLFLLGDPLSLNTFKGVKITATNLTVNSGSHISADYKGYGPGSGPGTPTSNRAGASYGGVGGWGGVSIYGSAKQPLDLGSGGPYTGRGGGAVSIVITGVFTNNGIVSANGGGSSSGGSIYVITKDIVGTGIFQANGGGYSSSSVYYGQGGGGRIAIYYQTSSFSGQAVASGGCGSLGMGYPYECGGSGTSGLFNLTTNDFYTESSWRFQKNDEPFNFNNIYISNNAKATSENSANITASNIFIDNNSSFSLADNQILNIPTITVDVGSILTLSGSETIMADSLTIKGNSIITIIPEKILSLTIPNITLDSGSSISADEKGYGSNQGPGAPVIYYAGASYGGVGYLNSPTSTYGSATEPTDFGSGGAYRGGGAIKLIVSGSLTNNGMISANGNVSGSGGSILINADNMAGSGTLRANGGSLYASGYFKGPGGGGRVAIYYQTSSFSGIAEAKGGCGSYDGFSKTCAGDGTVVMETLVPACTTDCFSNVLFLPGLMGSRLYEEGLNCGSDIVGPECGDQELWVSTSDPSQEKLALNDQGKSINNLYTKDDTQKLDTDSGETGIVDEISFSNIYKSFIDDLRNWKQDGTIADYAFIPYDWRLSLDDVITNGAASINNNLSYTNPQNFSESFILKKLEALQKNSKSGKVTIIAHSNGGLVAKALVQKLKDTNNPLYDKIDKVILIAVPQVGTPDALKSLLHGDKIGWGPIGMSAERERNLAQNMPVAYNLLPSKEYFNSINTTVPLIGFDSSSYYANSVTQYGYAIDNYIELQNYLKNSEVRQTPSYSDLNHANTLNDGLIQNSEITHDLLDAWVPSSNTKIIEVAGWGEYTLGGIGYRTEQECIDHGFVVEGFKLIYTCLAYKDKQALSITDILGGDGTVINESAHYLSDKNISNTEKWWVDLAEYNNPFNLNFPQRVHKDILEISGLLDFIKYKIKDSTENYSFPYVSQFKPSSNKPYTRIQLNSPLTLDLYDSFGNHTGLTSGGEIEENIPGSRYKTIGESKYILVPKDISTNLELKGYQGGSFSLSIDSLLGDEKISSTTFSAIPSSTTTLVTMDLPANTEISISTPLVIDFNGDGTIDKELIPKPNEEVIYDTTPPELQVTFDLNTKDVIFSAQDTIDKNPTTVTTKTSTTLTDSQGNTTIIPFTKYKEKSTKLKFSYNKIIRNGITTIVPNTNIVYDWKEKKGVLTDLDTKIIIKGIEKYTFSYNKTGNITIIKEKIGKNITTTKREGFIAVTLKTEENNLNVSY